MFGRYFIFDGLDYAVMVLHEMDQIKNLMVKFGIEFEHDEIIQQLKASGSQSNTNPISALSKPTSKISLGSKSDPESISIFDEQAVSHL